MAKKQTGGVNFGSGQVNAWDIVGGNKKEYLQLISTLDQDEKSGWILFIERSFKFLWTMTLGGLMLGGAGYFIGYAFIGDGAEVIGSIIGVALAFLFAITMVANVSRYRV
jgi:hypothetical protein